MPDIIAGRIHLLDPVSQGASGTVWRAVDQRLDALCAAKVMRQRDGADILRFMREQSVGSRHAHGIDRQENLLIPYTWVAEDDTIALIMPLLRGGTLADALADHGALAPTLVSALLRQLLAALTAVHAAGWVHRDVKPANLLFGGPGADVSHLYLADFGVALHRDDHRLTATGFVCGTPGYLSPEQLRGAPPSPTQDLWAAGAVALHALIPGRDLRSVPDLRELLPPASDGDTALHDVLAGLLSPDPAARPTAAEAHALLPEPSGDPADWSLTANGEPFEIFDQLGPLPAGSPGAGLPLVPPQGPADLAVRPTGLHDVIAQRARDTTVLQHRTNITAVDDAASGAAAPTPASAGRRWLLPALIVLAALAAATAVVLGFLALQDDGGRGPAASASGTPGTSNDVEPASTPTAAPADACGWHEEGREVATTDGHTLQCIESDEGEFLWEEK
ncbi:MAG: serine/threonine-protein kinase [Galactobacter sp.]